MKRKKSKPQGADYPQKIKAGMKRSTIFVCIALIIIMGFTVYANSLDGQFIWDDDHLVKNNPYIKDWSKLSEVLGKPVGQELGRDDYFYRPLQALTYMVDYSIWGLQARGYHLSNILWHILTALAVFWLISVLYQNWQLALLTSLFFVIHPIHTEAVSYISGRADSLAGLFLLLCLIFYIKGFNAKGAVFSLAMVFCCILALFARENSLILPLLLLLYHYNFKQKISFKFLPMTILCLGYICLRLTVFKSLLPHLSATTNLLQRLPGFFAALFSYFKLLVLPFNLHMEYSYRQFSFSAPDVLLGMILFLGLLSWGIRAGRNKAMASFAIFWFLISLLPSANLYPINAYMAEHWLYLPSIGLFLILSRGLVYLYQSKQSQAPALLLSLSLVAFYSYLTIQQNNYWRDPITFYQRTLKYNPGSPRIYNNLAVANYNLGKQETAINLYKQAIALAPNYAEAYYNLANVYSDLDQNSEAINAYKKAIEYCPDCVEIYNNLGNLYRRLGQTPETLSTHQALIKINPDYAPAYYGLGITYRSLGKNQQAIAAYQQAIELDPEYAQAYNNLANIYRDLGKTQEALAAYKKAIEIAPNYAEAYYNLANVYSDLDQRSEAINAYQKALTLKPDYAKACHNLSITYLKEQQYQLAIQYCDQAKELGVIDSTLSQALQPYRK